MRSVPGIRWISPGDPPDAFPAVDDALPAPNGLLAAGGDLSPARLLYAYRQAIFPWFDGGQPILWWSPDPRCVLIPAEFHVARRLRRKLRGSALTLTFDRAFAAVIRACAQPRSAASGTWITPGMIDAYTELHGLGWAHSVELWQGERLAGGVYGVAISRVFFGESMFSRIDDGSKIALLALCRHLAANDFDLLDCQLASPHLTSLGARSMRRSAFAALLRNACAAGERVTDWPTGPSPASGLVSG